MTDPENPVYWAIENPNLGISYLLTNSYRDINDYVKVIF